MILSDNEILAALQHEQIIITPDEHMKLGDGGAIKSSSVDLRLGSEFKRWKPSVKGMTSAMDPSADGFNFETIAQEYTEDAPTDGQGVLTLEPNDFVLATTAEHVTLSHRHRLAARVEGRSSLARLGMTVHVTAPTIHAGFAGKITLEIKNVGPLSIRLRPGLVVCQLVIEQVFGTPSKAIDSQFVGQQSATGRKTAKKPAPKKAAAKK